jgi:transcription elongation factor GreA
MVPGMSGANGGGEPITEEGIVALREEIEQLEGPGRTAMAARIKVAREEGDLKENAEYHIAKEDQAHLETKIKRLRERLRTAVVVEVDGGADCFSFGRTAEVLDEEKGAVNTWTLVGSTEADLAARRVWIRCFQSRRRNHPDRTRRRQRIQVHNAGARSSLLECDVRRHDQRTRKSNSAPNIQR